jgi:hypothetical protein
VSGSLPRDALPPTTEAGVGGSLRDDVEARGPLSDWRVRAEGRVQRDSGHSQEGREAGLDTLTMWLNAGEGTHGQGEREYGGGGGGGGEADDVANGVWSELSAGIAQAFAFRLTSSTERCGPSSGGRERWQEGEGGAVGPGGMRGERDARGMWGEGGAAASLVIVQEARSRGRDLPEPEVQEGVRGVLWAV